MKKLFVSIILPWMAVILIASAMLTAPMPGRCEAPAEWVRIPGVADSGANCLGISGDGTRFLMGTLVSRLSSSAAELDMYITDAGTGMRTPLYLSDSVDADAMAASLLAQWKMDEAKGEELVQQYGGTAAFVIRWMWPGWCTLTQACGDYILVKCGYMGQVLINMRSGETVPLLTDTAVLGTGGLAAVCQRSEPCTLYDPETSAYAPYTLNNPEGFSPLCLYPLPDGGTAGILRSDGPVLKSLYEFRFAYFDADGTPTETIPAGPIACGMERLRLIYSQETGVGVTYNGNYALKIPPLLFREGAAAACALWLDGPDALQAREVPCAELFDAKGELTVPIACKLVPISMSGDGKSLMLFDYAANNLLLMDLQTLEVQRLLTIDQAADLFALRGLNMQQTKSALLSLGWNGGAFLGGWLTTPGYALKLPLDEGI